MSYAKKFIKQKLIEEINRLRELLPDTEACKRNIQNIESQRPIDKMSLAELMDYLDLFHRSIK